MVAVTGWGVDPNKTFGNKEIFTMSAVPDWCGLDFLSSPNITKGFGVPRCEFMKNHQICIISVVFFFWDH